MKIIFFVIVIMMINCGKSCPINYFKNVTHYQINPNKVTKSGFKVDISGYDVDLDKLDERLLNIEKCLYDTYEENPLLSNEEVLDGECLEKDLHISQTIDRDCFATKIVDPIFSKCSDYQFIKTCETCEPAYTNPQYCIDKGIIPTEECKCTWRCALQDNTLITPPAIYLWDVVRNQTRCGNVFKIPYSECTKY